MIASGSVGFFWMFDGASVIQTLELLLYIGTLTLLPMAGWVLIKRRFGVSAAGALWPLLFFLILASVYATATPPWQTPDEPRHMIYVELVRTGHADLPARITSHDRLGIRDELAVQDVNNAVHRSLQRVDLWPREAQGLIDSGEIPGPDELAHPPLYYRVAAVVVAPFGSAPLLARLAVLRAFGVMAAMGIVWLCGLAGRLIWPDRRRLSEAPMAVAAGIPTFAAFAGTVNSDVLVDLFAAAFLVVMVRLLVRRSRSDWLWLVVAIALLFAGALTKRTFLPVAASLPIVLLLRRRWSLRRVLTTAIVVQLAAATFLLTLPTRPGAWTGIPGQDIACSGGRPGRTALCNVGGGILQQLTVPAFTSIRGKDATIGFWTYSQRPAAIVALIGPTPTEVVRLDGKGWEFDRVQFGTPAGLREMPVAFVADAPIRLDGVILTKGRFSDASPTYLDGGTVRWDGRLAKNLFVNSSAEERIAKAPRWFPTQVRRTFDGAADTVYSVRSGRMADSWPFVWRRMQQTFGIFWGTVGWDQPPRLLPPLVLWAIALIVALGIGGACAAAVARRPGWPWRPIAGVVVALGIGVLAVAARGIPPTDVELISGRYLFPEILALAVVLVAGWRWILHVDDRRFRLLTRWFAVAMHVVYISFVVIPFRWS